jgi:hypothetical protein
VKLRRTFSALLSISEVAQRRGAFAAVHESACGVITGRSLIADHFVGAMHLGLSQRPRRFLALASAFGLTGQSKRNLINALK